MYAIYFTRTMQPMWTSDSRSDLAAQCDQLNSKFGFGTYAIGTYVQEPLAT